MKKVGETIIWKDVNGRERQGEVEEIVLCYKVRMANGATMQISVKEE